MLLNFLHDHWQVILSIFLLILSVVVSLIKKKPVYNTMDKILLSVYEQLPVFISLVEKDGHGSEKLQTVLALVKTYVLDKYGFNNFDVIKSQVTAYIEDILTTPQKKEV